MLLKNEAIFLVAWYLFMQNIVIFVSQKHFWRGGGGKEIGANVLFLSKNGRFPNWTTGGALH